MDDIELLDKAIRRVPDFPKPGILFYDITGVLTNPPVFKYCIDRLAEICRAESADCVSAIESRGFLFAAPLAIELQIPLILIRKKGKLPGKVYSCKYTLEYGEAEVEAHCDDVPAGRRVLVIDDLIATGGTLKAAQSVLEQGGAAVAGFAGVIGLPFLNFRDALAPLQVTTLIDYGSE